MNSKCETCKFLKISPGDIVPYGSTTAHLPDEWDCDAEWKDSEDSEHLVLALFNGEIQDCPHYAELPKCPKHPDQYLGKYGCASCEEEYHKSIQQKLG